MSSARLLSALRVIDLTDEWGLMAGSILADLGADVIQVEPPGGSAARRIGPFAQGKSADPEQSLFWWGYARNKRSVELDVATRAGRETFLALLEGADCLIESTKPGYLSSVGLGYTALAEKHPGLIVTSITPFGQTGPKALWPATDITIMSASGYQYTCGDHDRAPLRIAVPQAYPHAAMTGVVGTLLALRERAQSGLGQHVDISAQEAATCCSVPAQLAEPWGESPMVRRAGGYMHGGIFTRTTYPAKDGFVSISFLFGSTVGPATQRLVQWMYSEGGCDESVRDKDYVAMGARLMGGDEPLSELARVHETVARFTGTKTKAELLKAAQDHDLLIAPCATIAEVRHDAHLATRGFYEPVQVGANEVHVPGPFGKFSGAPLEKARRAPRIGEHTSEVVAELRSRPKTAPAAGDHPTGGLPLKGLKVLDFGWAMVEPSSMRVLADFGATVIKVESTKRFDTLRSVGTRNGGFDPDCSLSFQDFSAGKTGIALDLTKPEAQEVVRRLAAWADVLGESFTPSAMRRWNLHYEALREVNDRLVYLSTCLGGQFGPYSGMAGYGNLSAALTGFNALCGWPDRAPAGPNGYYTDYATPPFIVAAVLAALEYRDRTGKGQHIDIAQIEAPVHFLTPAILDYEVNGRVLERAGNRSEEMAPHGVFPCLGDDRWVALAVEDDAQWTTFCILLGRPEFARDRRFNSLAARKQNEDAIEQEVGAWTSRQAPETVQDSLIAAGIPAHVVSNARDLYNDAQLQHRCHWVSVPHATLGDIVVETTRVKLSRTPGRTLSGAPTIGQDTFSVLTEIAGYSPDEVANLAASGVLQ
ncbi:MAG: CoA transferase [Chloroflexi bacterium]|nr:CoA transferase [Chloroflexota bacterium]